MTSKPLVSDHMSVACHSVARDDLITDAKELMLLHGVRHLPVLEGGKLVGLVSLADLYAVEAVMELDPDETEVGQAMSQDVYSVGPDTPLADVAAHMAQEHIGSVVIVKQGELLGVFTASDACRVLAEILKPE